MHVIWLKKIMDLVMIPKTAEEYRGTIYTDGLPSA